MVGEFVPSARKTYDRISGMDRDTVNDGRKHLDLLSPR